MDRVVSLAIMASPYWDVFMLIALLLMAVWHVVETLAILGLGVWIYVVSVGQRVLPRQKK